MSAYDPFSRGSRPAGVRTVPQTDAARERTLPIEVWYPASDAHAGQDLDEATQDRFQLLPGTPEIAQAAVRDAAAESGPHPLVVFSHGFGGTRLQTTHFCTHLASHGYVVVAPDHVGNTSLDMMQAFMEAQTKGPPDPAEMLGRFAAHRPADASFVIDRALAGDLGVSADEQRIGMTGHSFGGWTTLQTTARDARIRAALPLAPAGGANPLTGGANPLGDALDMDWDRPVPVLYLVADQDTLLPLEGMHELLSRTRSPGRMIVLRNADHMHFCDRVEETHDLFRQMGSMLFGTMQQEGGPDVQAVFSNLKPSGDLCPGKDAYALIQGLGLAHMDACLRDSEPARAFLAQDLADLLGRRGVRVEVVEPR